MRVIVYGALLFCLVAFVESHSNKYSAEANKKEPKKGINVENVLTSLRNLDKPYRMAKLNLLWAKAKHVS